MNDLQYFKLAKKLNDQFHAELLEKQMHFRGNKNSMSLISLSPRTAEKGISNIKNEADAVRLIESDVELEEPKRDTPEKELQAWIILNAIKNEGFFAFDPKIHFITSEIVFENTVEYELKKDIKDIRNDLLGIDEENNLCVIELKSSRANEVKKQAIEFEKVVRFEKDFFKSLVEVYSNKTWNGNIRKIAIWPHTTGRTRANDYPEVELIGYTVKDGEYSFYPEL